MPDARSRQNPAPGFGVIAGLAPDLLSALAHEVAALGYGSFWINDGGGAAADGLAGLAIVATAEPSLHLGVGVLPLDRRTPADIAREIEDLGLPLARLRLGVGSGSATRKPLVLVRHGVEDLRLIVPGARIYIAALGPWMSRLAGEIADGVLFNWAIPERLGEMSELVAEGEREAGRRPIERWAYVRVAVGPDARERLAAEARRYARSPAYGRAFAAMGRPFEEVGIAAEDLRPQLSPYREVLDGVVVRALPREWRLDDVLEIARAAVTGLVAR
jgi:alkanesulfonate monooxygenase SsuD/methylene tetrahydromethanopterin reductase-like flavin-dependent oxidoreductase (luciferase family)